MSGGSGNTGNQLAVGFNATNENPSSRSMGKVRGWLNEEWAAVTLPMFAFTCGDGLIKSVGTGNEWYETQAVVAAILALTSVIGRPAATTIRQTCVTFSLAVVGALGGVYHGIPVAEEEFRQTAAHRQAKITPETQIPASVLCNAKNSNGIPFEVTINGKDYALICPKP